jgi:excinuclease ABC subunit C
MALFKDVVKNLPQKPGVYRFYTQDRQLLYIGKAKNLKNRVSSYFQEGRPKNQRLTLMISQIDQIEYTVVSSERESLILEANLIHSLQPKYNVLLKDDKSYLYVRITNDPIPGIFLTRRKYDPQSHYFGPYTKRSGIFETLRVLRTIFPYCQERVQQKRPCNYYGIKQCDGACVGKEDMLDYNLKIEQIKNVLSGKTELVVDFVKQKIAQAIELQNYELAALWRDRLRIFEQTVENQKVILPHPQDLDLITLILQENNEGLQIGSVFVQNVRGGKIINVLNFLLSGTEEIEQDEGVEFQMLERFFSSYYSHQTDEVGCIAQVWKVEDTVLNQEPKRIQLTANHREVLEALSGVEVHIRNTFDLNKQEIGDLLEQGKQNAFIYLQRNQLGQKLSLFEENNLYVSLVDLQRKLSLDKVPKRIECYDISHLSGKFVYGSMVVFVDGRPAKKFYKLFKTKEQNNDFENHQEVLRRRFERAFVWEKEHQSVQESEDMSIEEIDLDNLENHTFLESKKVNPWVLPDLIIVDGGKGQLSADLAILDEYKAKYASENMCFEVEMCALAKREEEVFLPNRSESVMLDGQTKFLVQRIRDEAHRFAITNNRNARLRTISKSRLDEIPGIGSVTKQKLLSTFGSIEGVVKSLDKNPELLYELVGKNVVNKLKEVFNT